MANEQVRIDLEANDKASDKIDDVADKVDKLEKADPEVTVTADTSAATSDLKDVAATADTLTSADHKIILQAKIDETKADLKSLDQQLKGLDDSAATTGHKIGADIEEGSGKAKDAVHGFTGEAITSLPLVGDAVGPAGEAIGQMTEGLLAGEIAMGELVAAAIPLVAMTVAFKLISGYFADIEATKAFHKDQVDKWVTSLKAGKTTLQGINEELEKTGQIEFIDDGDIKDASDAMVRLGIDVQDLTTAVGDSTRLDQWKKERDAVEEVLDKLRNKAQFGGMTAEEQATWDAAGQKLKDYNEVIDATTQKKKDHADAEQALRDKLKLVAPDLDKVAGATSRVGEAARNGKDPVDKFGDALADTDTNATDANSSLEILLGTLDLRDKADAAEQAIKDLNVTILEHGGDWEAVDDAARGAAEQVAIYAQSLNLPPTVETHITAMINQGQLDEARRLLDSLAKGITVPITAKLGRSVGPGSHILDEALGIGGTSVVNVNLPRGYRGDVVAEVTGATRRNGRRYGARAVRYARR